VHGGFFRESLSSLLFDIFSLPFHMLLSVVNSAVAKVEVYQVLKLLFDERVRFLGSLVEIGVYRVSGIFINEYEWVRMIRFAKDGWMNWMIRFGNGGNRRLA
jgi:hypothetical protein